MATPDETADLDHPVEQPKPKRDFRQEVTDSIVEMLEKCTAPLQKPCDPQKAFDLPINPESAKTRWAATHPT